MISFISWNRLRVKGVCRIATEGNLKHDTAILGLACFQRAANDIGTKAYDAQAQPVVLKLGATSWHSSSTPTVMECPPYPR